MLRATNRARIEPTAEPTYGKNVMFLIGPDVAPSASEPIAAQLLKPPCVRALPNAAGAAKSASRKFQSVE